MIKNKKIIAVITARGGSKRLPEKNIKEIAGQPLIKYTLNAARDSKYIDKIIVSSDDEKIIDIALKNQCIVDKRNPSLSHDNALTIDVIKDLLSREKGFDIIVTLQPTSPLRSSSDIDNALDLYIEKNADAVISVCKSDHPPQWINKLGANGEMDKFMDTDFKNKRSQDLGNYYRLNGAIFCNNIEKIMHSDTLLFDKKTFAYLMKTNSSIDIDTIDDFEYAEYLLKKN